MGLSLVVLGLVIASGAGVVALLALAVGATRSQERDDVARIVDTLTVPVASLGSHRPVEVKGVARVGQPGLARSPVSGRDVLAYWIDIGVARRKHNGGLEFPTAEQLRFKPGFWVEDHSGHAWVNLEMGQVIMPETRYGGLDGVEIGGRPQKRVDITDAMQAWAEGRTGRRGRKHQVVESVIADGDPVYVLGWASHHQGVPTVGSGPHGELLVSTYSEEQLLDLMRGRASRVRGCLGVAVATTGLGVLLAVAGVLSLAGLF